MKMLSKIYKKRKENKNQSKGGFTLIELLAVITILALVSSVVITVATSVVSGAKKKSYQVTINNIEKESGNYAIENQSSILWEDDGNSDNQYFCVKVKDLIETGYFKSDVLDSNIDDGVKVESDNYIYLERNETSKAVAKNILLVGDSEVIKGLKTKCGLANTDEKINITLDTYDWAREKTLTIKYELRNISDSYSNYEYGYQYYEKNGEELVATNIKDDDDFDNSVIRKEVTVTKNGTMNAYIEGEEQILSLSKDVSKIDTTVPDINVSVNNGTVWSNKKTVTIGLTDGESGFRKGNYKVYYEWSDSETGMSCEDLKNSPTSESSILKVNDNYSNPEESIIYEVAGKTGDGKVYVCGENIKDYVGNTFNEVVSKDMYLDNVKPVVKLGTYTGAEIVHKSVTIPLVIEEDDSGVKDFDVEKIVVSIGGKELTSGISLNKVSEKKYNLVISNSVDNGKVKIVVKKDGVLDNADNGNIETTFNPNIEFINIYTISYNANGGSGAPSAQTKTHGVTLTLSTTKPTRTGYTFQGWGTSSTTSTVSYNPGSGYTANSGITLYAVWKLNTYTVSYNANGGSGAPSAQTKTYGVALTLSSTKPTRTGYTFQGWGTSSTTSTVSYNPGSGYTANSGITLYAVWKVNTYTVSYNANGGSGAPSAQTKTHGVTLTLSSTKPTRTGYTFQGWGTSSTTSTVSYNPGSGYTANQGITLYAIWKYNSSSGGGGGSSGSCPNNQIFYNFNGSKYCCTGVTSNPEGSSACYIID